MNNDEFARTIRNISATRPLVGVDVGGTKTRIDIMWDGLTNSWTTPSEAWRTNSDDVLEKDMICLGELITSQLEQLGRLEQLGQPEQLEQLHQPEQSHQSAQPGQAAHNPQAHTPMICVGLHGADFPEQLALANTLLNQRCPGTVTVVNDAELLGPAVGLYESINMVVGTGSNVVGQTSDHTMLRAGGYGFGWLLSDFGSAPSLARESVRELLLVATLRSEKAAMQDALWPLLAERLGIRTITELPLAIGGRIGETEWGSLAPLVFAAIANGSHVARTTLNFAVDVLAGSVESLVQQGAVGNAVVAAGGVITHQPVMQQLLRERLAQIQARALTLHILDRPPIEGALALAAHSATGAGFATKRPSPASQESEI